MTQEPYLSRLTLQNFKSYHSETVEFANPLILVGRNGSGKTNLVSALSFLSECMERPLRSVMETAGGLGSVGSIDTPLNSPYITLRADFRLPEPSSARGHYSVSIRVTEGPDFVVAREQCWLEGQEGDTIGFERGENQFSCTVPGITLSPDQQSLALPVLGAVDAFARTVKSLGAMRVYTIDPSRVASLQGSSSSRVLERDGSNAAGVLHSLALSDPSSPRRIGRLLGAVTPGMAEVWTASLLNGNYVLEFGQRRHPDMITHFAASAMSDGTLRALGLIVALMQNPLPSLLVLEEPEAVVHPGALGVIADIIEIAAQRTQVVVTTHSPELLDAKWIQPENLRVVEWENGSSRVSEIGDAPVASLRRHLASTGELLRANALDAAPQTEDRPVAELFDRVTA